MTTCKLFRLAGFSIPINRSDGVDHVSGGEASAGCDDGLSGWQTADLFHNLFASSEYRWSTRTMNCTVHAASAQQGRVRGVHDGVCSFGGNVGGAAEFDLFIITKPKPKREIGHWFLRSYFL